MDLSNPEEQKELIVPVGECIVVEQVMFPKNGDIIVEGGGEGNSENFEFKFTIIAISNAVKEKGEIQVGDIPVFAKHSTFQAAKVLEKGPEKQVLHTLFYSHDLVGVVRKVETESEAE